MTFTDLQTDLRERWRPDDAAETLAAIAYQANPNLYAVVTGHLLIGKTYGAWTADVEVEGVPTAAALVPLETYTTAYSEAVRGVTVEAAVHMGDRSGTIGYTVHNSDGTWSVFEEILTADQLTGGD